MPKRSLGVPIHPSGKCHEAFEFFGGFFYLDFDWHMFGAVVEIWKGKFWIFLIVFLMASARFNDLCDFFVYEVGIMQTFLY